MKVTKLIIFRLAATSAIAAGVCFLIVGFFHPANLSAVVASSTWINVHLVAILMCLFGLFGIFGLYARQMEAAGWLGLVGTVFLSCWFLIVTGFSFIEAFVLPHLKSGWLAFVDNFLNIFSGKVSNIDWGVLPILWNVSGPMFILGLAFFGIATFIAGTLPKYAGGLLVVSAVLVPLGALLSPEHQSLVLVPPGSAFIWLGVALFINKEISKKIKPIKRNQKKKNPLLILANKIINLPSYMKGNTK